ncbi:MAG: NAD(+) synthase [Planctomycetaceae bacterium]
MKLIRVGAAILNQTPMDWEGNAANIRKAIASAREQGVSVLCLPELCITGYGCEDMFLSPGVWETSWSMLQELAAETKDMVVAFSLPVFHGNGVYNTACVVVDGIICGFVAKRHLAGDGLHYEPRWFREWPADVVSEFTVGDDTYVIGDCTFDIGGVRIGFEICEDAWVASRPGSGMAARGVDIIMNPSASHFAFGKHEVRKRFVLEGSRSFGVSYVYANLLGNESGRAVYDGGALIATGSTLVASGPRFTCADAVVTAATIDVDLNRMAQAKTFSMRSEVAEDDLTLHVFFDIPETDQYVAEPTFEPDVSSQEEEFTRAISLALFDYLRKSRSRGFVVSMSGGADSSAVACLIRSMVELTVNEIGAKTLCERLSYIEPLAGCDSVDSIMSALFLGVYQATTNSSETTRRAAQEVTEGVGGVFMELDVDPLVNSYVGMIEKAIGRDLTWDKDDLTLQNIQARTRGPGVWMLANLRNALLLATSNRSEAAVGYATMDGDTCGGLSPVGGIDKAFLRQWLRWMETDGPTGGAPIPSLSFVNSQQPTAELRPTDSDQTDEGDLMPYPLLDAIECAAIRDKAMPDEVLTQMKTQFPNHDETQLKTWITKFFTLWCRNQWKRERYAPAFHVDDKNLDPKTWCRFPILSSGYAKELGEL